MALDLFKSQLALPVKLGRQGPLSDALNALGDAAFGHAGVPACNHMAIAATDQDVIGDLHQPLCQTHLTRISDPILDALALGLFRVDAPGVDPTSIALEALLLRAGLLGRILDIAYAHLRGRVSMGKKTLSHQLVKAGFADAYGVLRLTCEIVTVRAETKDLAGLDRDHNRLTEATLEAEKLMGGHGFLLDGTHPIGYLSMLLHVIYGPR